jgi:glutamate synthase (NADPH/NADH) small chain
MPEWQELLYRGDWVRAWQVLEDANPFPEFTGRVCPALCEASCVLGCNDEPVTIRQNELAVIEKAFELGLVQPRPPAARINKRISLVGAGPAGLAAAYCLNRAGFQVTVIEADRKAGGYLRYGIPDFKLDKSFIDRRIAIMEEEGVEFKTGVRLGQGRFGFAASGIPGRVMSAGELIEGCDLAVLTIGAREPRDIDIPGRELSGIVQALDYLTTQNRVLAGENPQEGILTAFGKRVAVIGGGDTGVDCVGTANRQGALRVTQIEVMPRPPEHRSPDQPWPLWPRVIKTSSSHLEGGERLWSIQVKAFIGRADQVEAVRACRVEWSRSAAGAWTMKEIPGSDFEIGADLVILAMGFVHVVQDGLVKDLGIELDGTGNIRTEGSFHTSQEKVWAAGDSRKGAGLVVHAIADGKAAARRIIAHFS